jgi:hypothetical protein
MPNETVFPSFSSATLHPGKPNTESASTELDGGGSLPQPTVAITLPPSSGSSQHVLRRGNSAENLRVSVQQHAQKGTSAPNGTLKKLKTGKEQVSSHMSLWCCVFVLVVCCLMAL